MNIRLLDKDIQMSKFLGKMILMIKIGSFVHLKIRYFFIIMIRYLMNSKENAFMISIWNLAFLRLTAKWCSLAKGKLLFW
jgi:hypothetical protein